jgi:anti-anti-sigma factor
MSAHLEIHGGADEPERIVRFLDPRIIDVTNVEDIKVELLDLPGETPCRWLLDFTGVEYMSSAFIGVLVRFQKRIRKSGGEVILTGVGEPIRRVLLISGITKIFPILDQD